MRYPSSIARGPAIMMRWATLSSSIPSWKLGSWREQPLAISSNGLTDAEYLNYIGMH